MGRREEIEGQIAKYQKQLANLNRMPEDRFSIGTMMVFSSESAKWYIRKVGEEAWTKLNSSTQTDLAGWILEAEESNVGYFEVYEMRTQPNPIYAKGD